MLVEVLTRFCGNNLVLLFFHEKLPLMKIICVMLSFCPQNNPGLYQQRKCMVVYSARYLSYTGNLSRSNVF